MYCFWMDFLMISVLKSVSTDSACLIKFINPFLKYFSINTSVCVDSSEHSIICLVSVGPGQLIVDILLAFLVCHHEVKGSGLDIGQINQCSTEIRSCNRNWRGWLVMVVIVVWRVLPVVSLIKPGLLVSSSILVISIISVRERFICIICVYLLTSWDVISQIFGRCWPGICRIPCISSGYSQIFGICFIIWSMTVEILWC